MGLCESSKNENIKCNIIEENPRILHSFKSLAITAKSVCKILFNQKQLGCGFLIQLFKRSQQFFCLMTTDNIVNKKMIKDKVTIDVVNDIIESISLKIELNSEKRSIKNFTELNIDITVIEILPSDKIPQDYFLLPLKDYIDNYDKLINKDIMILHYPNGIISSSFGKINRLVEKNNYEFIHDAITDKGSSGSPIFLEGNIRVIGINKSENKNSEENYGYSIWPIFNFFKNYSENNI